MSDVTLSVTMADADWQLALAEHMELRARESAGGPAFMELMGKIQQEWTNHILQSAQQWDGKST